MDSPETLATLGTQDIGRRPTKQNANPHKTKNMRSTDPTKKNHV